MFDRMTVFAPEACTYRAAQRKLIDLCPVGTIEYGHAISDIVVTASFMCK